MLLRSSCINKLWQYECDGSVISISATPNCSLICATTVGRTAYLLDSKGNLLWSNSLEYEGWSTSISPDGSYIAIGTASKIPSDGSIHVFNSNGDEMLVTKIGSPVWSLSFSEDGKILAASCWDGKVYKFVKERTSFKLAEVFDSKSSSGLYGIKLSKDGKNCYVCDYGSGLIVLDENWKKQKHYETGNGLYNLHLADEVGVALAGSRDGKILKFDLETDEIQEIKIYDCQRPVCGVAASSEAELIVCGGFDGWVYLVNEHGIPLGKVETNGEIWSVATSYDASFICAGSGDHTVWFLQNCCGLSSSREIDFFEKATVKGEGDTSAALDRLVGLYAKNGVYEYGFIRLRELKKEQSGLDTVFDLKSKDLLLKAVKNSSGCHWAHYELALLYQAAQKHSEAIYHFQQAAKSPTFASRAMTNCADSFRAKTLPTATIACYRRAREQQIDREAKRVLYYLGMAYEDTKKWSSAISHYQLLASWDVKYRNTWERLEHLLAVHGAGDTEAPSQANYTGMTTSLLGPDTPRDVDENLKGVLQARTAEILIKGPERFNISQIINKLRGNEKFCRGISGKGLEYDQELFLKYDYALPEDETKKFLETVNLLYLLEDKELGTTLDIGSATGRYPTLMKWLGAKETYGIDVEPRAIQYAEAQKEKEQEFPKYINADARELPFDKPKFDLVTCMMGTFAHIPSADQQAVIQKIYDALLKDGYIAISTWDMNCGHLAYLSLYSEKQKEIIRKNSPSMERIKQMMKKTGFHDIEIRPFCMLPQVVVYDLGIENLRSVDIELAAQADLAVRSLYPSKSGEMYLAFGRK